MKRTNRPETTKHHPFVFLWAFIYGVPAGIFYALLALAGYAGRTYCSLYIEWKKHPERLRRKMRHASGALSHVASGALFPILLGFSVLCLTLAFLPLYFAKGVFYGPAYILREGLVFQ